MAGRGDVRYVPGLGYVDLTVLERNPKLEPGERLVLLHDAMHGGHTIGASLDRGFIYGAGELPTVTPAEGQRISRSLRGRVVVFDAPRGTLVDTDLVLRPSAEVEVLLPTNERKKLPLAKLALDFGGGHDVGSYIADWPHLPTEEELFDKAEAVRKAVEERCAWLPFKVEVLDISGRFIFYWSGSTWPEQQWFLTMAPAMRNPFNDEWKMSKRYLDEYPPERVAKGEMPPEEWRAKGERIKPLLYRGGAFLIRPVIAGKHDLFRALRIYVREDTSFIVSDQCQRAEAISRDGANMQYSTQWAIDTWLLTYIANKHPDVATKGTSLRTGNLKHIMTQDDAERGPAMRRAAYYVMQVEQGGAATIAYSKDSLNKAKKAGLKYSPEHRMVYGTLGGDKVVFLHFNLARHGKISPEGRKSTGRIYAYKGAFDPRMTPSEITSLFAAWFYFDGNYMADWAPLVGSILEEAGDLELLFCLLENTGWFGAQFTKGQLEAKFNEIANQAREDALVAAATRPPADVPVVLPVAEEKPKKRRRTKLEQAADGPIAAAVMGEAAPEEANPFR